MTVGNHGNTSAASIPLAIDYAVESRDLKKEDTILLEAFGAGFTWGSTLLKF
jgi:3-oxoacyl-[acyl-carrier-protein] synthase-3